jgi:hypothetical protein
MPLDSEHLPTLWVGVGLPQILTEALLDPGRAAKIMQNAFVRHGDCDCGWTALDRSGVTSVLVSPTPVRNYYVRGVRLMVESMPSSGVKVEVLHRGVPVTGAFSTTMLHDAVPVDWPATSFESPLVLRFKYEPVDDNTARPVLYLACSGVYPETLTTCAPTEETQP